MFPFIRSAQGRYRIQVNDNGDTQVLVRDGQADVSTEQGSTQVHRGEMITIQGSADQAQYRVTAAPGNNDWDRWNDDRDHTIADAQSYQHTNPYYTGSQDLDQSGEPGAKRRITVQSGHPRLARIGRRTAMAAGFTNLTGDGPGFPTSPGVGLLIITAAGSSMAAAGLGGPVRFTGISPALGAGVRFLLRVRGGGFELRIWFWIWQRGLASDRPG